MLQYWLLVVLVLVLLLLLVVVLLVLRLGLWCCSVPGSVEVGR